MNLIVIIISLVPFYLFGAFPTGHLIAKLYGVDITARGSGNVGATNVARVVGRRAGILTLLGDVLKGALGVIIARIVVDDAWFPGAAAVAVVLGHCLSVPPYLKGGKGVATALGVITVLYPSSSIIALGTFGACFAIWKIVSLASIAATLIVPMWALITNAPDAVSVSFMVIAALIVMRHEQNIKRLIEGREPTFSSKKSETEKIAE
ncbi:MAG: glycerol-3-phosphate acyltransferase [Pseudomonadota bacterium]|jgi:glycerol-3-phosphate acyltransferase PlsY